MAKKIRFPLEMDGGVEVRDIESLRENFSLQRVMGYLSDGKLITWLRDRYANEMADALDELDRNDEALAKKIYEIFDIPFDEKTEENLLAELERAKRIEHLKQYTNEKYFINVIDQVAFDQEELYDRLDENNDRLYLCGEKFSIPLSKKGVKYVGINNPIVIIDSKVEIDWDEINIILENVRFDEKYEDIIRKHAEELITENNSIHEAESDKKIDEEKLCAYKTKMDEKIKFNMQYPQYRFLTGYFYESGLSSKRAAEKKAYEALEQDMRYVKKIFADDEGKAYVELGNRYLEDLQSICTLYKELFPNDAFDSKKIGQGFISMFHQLVNECGQLYNSIDWYNLGKYWVEEEYNGGGLFSPKTYRAQAEYKVPEVFYNLIGKCSKLFSDRYSSYKKTVFNLPEELINSTERSVSKNNFDDESNNVIDEETQEEIKYLSKESTVGDIVEFGAYYINNSQKKDDLHWKILRKEQSSCLVITCEAIDAIAYSDSASQWETSEIKNWLNGSFKTSAFNGNELKSIKGEVFLLSSEEAEEYFLSDEERKAKATAYAIQKGGFVDSQGNSKWWLRTPYGVKKICYVYSSGSTGYCTEVRADGIIHVLNGVDAKGTVRPAMWVEV